MADSRKLKITVTIIEGKDKSDFYEIRGEETTIGRAGSDIALTDSKVSRKHALIRVHEGRVSIKDLDSTNGVFVNDEKVSEANLKNLDEITIGFTRLAIAIVEDLKSFKEKNVPSFKSLESSSKRTGQKDIGKMIEEELSRFSRWDLAAEGEREGDSKEQYASKSSIVLEVLDGPDKGKKIKLKKGNTVLGRGKADVSFKDTDISRANSAIEIYGKDQVFVRDLASTNGTFVNGKKISYTRLKNKDKIQLGGTILELTIER